MFSFASPARAKIAMTHAIFHVSDLAATVAAAKAAGATMQGDVVSVPIGGMPVKIATVVDPDGNVLELMELPKGAATCRIRNGPGGSRATSRGVLSFEALAPPRQTR